MQICHGDYQGDERGLSLEDGRVYYREKAATRVARSGEIKALERRARPAPPPVRLQIETLAGHPRLYSEDEITDTFGILFGARSDEIRALWRRSEEELREYPAELEQTADAEWRSYLPALTGAAQPGIQLRIANPGGAWLEDIELTLVFPEGVMGAEKTDHPTLALSDLMPRLYPKPSRTHGPFGTLLPIDNFTYTPDPLPVSGYPLTWENVDGGVVVTISGIDLRPDQEWCNDDDDLVVVVLGQPEEAIAVAWQLTARGHDRSYKGVIEVPTENTSIREDFATVTARLRGASS